MLCPRAANDSDDSLFLGKDVPLFVWGRYLARMCPSRNGVKHNVGLTSLGCFTTSKVQIDAKRSFSPDGQ
jgi:hypothetical protein